MTREEAIRWLEDIHRRFNPTGENLENEGGDVHLQALDMAIETLSAEAVQGECRTCKRSSDYLWKNGEEGTRCPIEEHYALPKDGYCHLYEPYKGGDTE